MTQPSRRVRQREIAERAGVSIPVVSRALSGHGEIATATRDHVVRVAHELGYERSTERRGRPRGVHSHLVELALGEFEDPWGEEVVAGARQAAQGRGFDLVLASERETPGDDWADRIIERSSLGVVAGLIQPSRAQLSKLHDAGVPIVMLDPRADPPTSIPSVTARNRDGGELVADHLLELGHRRFLIVSGKPAYRYGRERIEGFRSRVDAVSATSISIIAADWNSQSAFEVCLDHLRGATAPDAIFALNDVLAVGALRAADHLGIRVPEQLSLVGFDDLPGARRMTPPLTTVRQPVREMAATAIDLLAKLIEAPTLAAPRREVTTTLVVRESTRRAASVT